MKKNIFFILIIATFLLIPIPKVKAYTPMFNYSPPTFIIEPQYDYINESSLDLFFSPLITALENKGFDYIIYIKNSSNDFNGYSEYQLVIFRDTSVPVSLFYNSNYGYVNMAIATCKNTQYISPSDCSNNNTLYNSKVITPITTPLFNTTIRDEYINYINNNNFPTSKFLNMYYTTNSNSKSYTFAGFSQVNVSDNVFRYNFIYQSSFDIKLTNIFNPTTTFWYDNSSSIMLYGIGDDFPTYKTSTISAPTLTIDSENDILLHIDDYDTFNLPSATATDIIDGDISNLITKSGTLAKLVGEWYVDYKVCNSNNLCTTKRINITVTDGFTDLVLLADRAVMFIPKNYQTYDFNNIKFQFFNKWTYAFYDLDTKKIIDEGIANSILDYGNNDTYKYFEWNYNYLLNKNIHFGVLFIRYGDITLNGVVRYNADIYNYRTYTEWNDDDDDISYIDYDGSNKNIDTDNIDIPTLQDNIDVKNSFFNDFNTNFFGVSDIITLPLNFLNNLTSNSCSPFILSNDIFTFTFPCMTSIYETHFPDLLSLWRLITDGIISYYVIVNILRLIKQMKDPENDKIEVYNL